MTTESEPSGDPIPDARWKNIVGHVSGAGTVNMMKYADLKHLSDGWATIVPEDFELDGPTAILRTSRSLFALSWFDYELMVVAALVCFQALESAFRVLYRDAGESAPLRSLVKRARHDGDLEPQFADIADTAVELRNLLSHPRGAAAFSVGVGASMLENTHRLVVLVLQTARHKSDI